MSSPGDLSPDPSFPITISPLPIWLKKWANAVRNSRSETDNYGEVIRLVHEEKTLRAILLDPAIAHGLEKAFQALQRLGCDDAEGRIFQVLAFACFGHSVATKTEFLSKGDIASELRALAKSARKVAKNIRVLSQHFPAADTLGYLVDRLRPPPDAKHRGINQRAGLRAGRYTVRTGSSPSNASDAPLRLPDLLDAFVDDLKDQLAFRGRAKGPRTKIAGANASRNYQIDFLIHHTNAALGDVPFALIAAIVSAANGKSVDESVVRKSPALRKIRPKKS